MECKPGKPEPFDRGDLVAGEVAYRGLLVFVIPVNDELLAGELIHNSVAVRFIDLTEWVGFETVADSQPQYAFLRVEIIRCFVGDLKIQAA